MMNPYLQKVDEAAAYLRSNIALRPYTGIILGSGLGSAMRDITWEHSVAYADIPHFPVTSVRGHEGALRFGYIEGHPVVVQFGRFHYYEGHDMKTVTFPLRVMQALGIERLVVTNAAGGLNEAYREGLLVALSDHINMFPEHPLRGLNDDRFGVRFPEMRGVYTPSLRKQIMWIARQRGVEMREGVYLGLSGPSIETPAELRYFKKIGADLVGMSTVPEVIVAKQLELDVLGVSIVTNMCFPKEEVEVEMHEKVLEVAGKSAIDLLVLLRDLFGEEGCGSSD